MAARRRDARACRAISDGSRRQAPPAPTESPSAALWTHRGDDGAGRVREELGKQFIAELGGLGRVLATAKFGMAPEMIELAEIVNASPELLEAMKNPAVKKILRDEKTRKELAALLVMAAQAGDAPANDADTQPNGQSAAA